MKNIAIILVAGLTTLSTACFNNGAKTKTANLSDDTTINSEKSIDGNGVANSTSANPQEVKDTMVLGKLYFVCLKEGEQPVMTALSLNGDRCGTGDFNHKPYATEGIRSVFELNEWIEFNPQATAASGIKVMVFKHQADQGFYLKNSLNDETPGYVLACDLNKDPDDETFHWGSFYLHPEEVEPGYYDFVFIYNNKVFATMLTRFFQEEEIQGKPDSELEKLMSEKRQ
ncbi:MAG: hypothetical protein K6F06_04180 [Bacteroidales bacterium]|nr:hypothetical protein [Bacteroidales bacterium]